MCTHDGIIKFNPQIDISLGLAHWFDSNMCVCVCVSVCENEEKIVHKYYGTHHIFPLTSCMGWNQSINQSMCTANLCVAMDTRPYGNQIECFYYDEKYDQKSSYKNANRIW